MALNHFQQALDLLIKNDKVLLVTQKDFSDDNIASILALKQTLQKIEKEVENAFSYSIPQHIQFLPGIEKLNTIPSSRDFILNIDTKVKKVKEIRYENGKDAMRVFLTPEKEPLQKEDISFETSGFNPDLIISVGSPDLESVGEVFEENPQLFFERPIINIDCSPSNENFGEVNLVEIASSSNSEIIYDFLEHFNQDLIKEELATALLAGIILKTDNFQNHRTSPKTLSCAASLMARGADHQLIIRNLYKTKRFDLLKALGKVLSNSRYLAELNLVFSFFDLEDFQEISSRPEDLSRILQEFRSQFLNPDLVMVFWPSFNSEGVKIIKGLGCSLKQNVLKLVQEKIGGEVKNNNIVIESNKNRGEIEKDIENIFK